MKRITHFKGYDSCVEFDQESQTFVSRRLLTIDHLQSAKTTEIVMVRKLLVKKVKKQNAMPRLKSEPNQPASSFI